ncbi:hypothetical protein EDB83DRAFT_2322196 [Lactarius deliciosus]|nr:hypothetical protein EDB83DRAFT_2322196 [Lactarius deliciosus]
MGSIALVIDPRGSVDGVIDKIMGNTEVHGSTDAADVDGIVRATTSQKLVYAGATKERRPWLLVFLPPPSPLGAPPEDVELSVFDILNIFRRCWFLSRAHLLANAISAQKAEDGKIAWVEFAPSFHSHLVKCAVALVPRPVPWVKRVMFVFVLELLNQEGHLAFFELQKGGRKANNAQKEKRRLARKRSRAAKRERDWEAANAAKLPPRERECLTCGRKFQSRKTAKKHKCSKSSKVVRKKEADAPGTGSHLVPLAELNKPVSSITPPAPAAPSHSSAAPPVTGDLEVPPNLSHFLQPPLDATLLLATLNTEQIYALMKKMTGAPLKYRAFEVRWRMLQDSRTEAETRETNERARKRRRQ